jgi:hypothetical protein
VLLGGEIKQIISYTPGQTDFTKEMKKLTKLDDLSSRQDEIRALRKKLLEDDNPKNDKDKIELPPIIDFQALFIPDYYKTIGQIAPALAFNDIEGVQLLGSNGWNNPELITRGKDFVEGSIFVDGYFSDSPNEIVKDFTERYYLTFNEDPKVISAIAYDSAKMIMDTIIQFRPNTGNDLVRALLSITDWPGVSGQTKITQTGDVEKKLFLLKVENGKIVQIN